jgi:hypothetical protein
MGVEMSSSVKETVLRALKSPIAIIGLVGSVLVVLANAAPAIDGAKVLWQRWTVPESGLETNWQGTWKSRSGYTYAFAMKLDVAEDQTAQGWISWELLATPPGSHLASRVGHTAIEYVSGRFDKANNVATVDGYEVSDPTLIARDTYKFQIKSDKISFVAMTKNHGDWAAQAQGSVIITGK